MPTMLFPLDVSALTAPRHTRPCWFLSVKPTIIPGLGHNPLSLPLVSPQPLGASFAWCELPFAATDGKGVVELQKRGELQLALPCPAWAFAHASPPTLLYISTWKAFPQNSRPCQMIVPLCDSHTGLSQPFVLANMQQIIYIFLAPFFKKNYLFIYFWLRWVFIAAHGLSLVAASGGYSSLWCVGFSLQWLLLLWSTGSRHMEFNNCGTRASVAVARGL